MAKAGVSEAKIRLFGRWASQVMLKYVREALLAEAGSVVAKQVEVGLGAAQQLKREPRDRGTGIRKWKALSHKV